MNENEFTRNGMRFVAVESADCNECFFEHKCISDLHTCAKQQRDDGRNVIWQRAISYDN
jgi:hypothetical protein